MKKIYLTLFLLSLLISCSSDSKKFEFAGGSITMAIDNQPSTFISREINDYYSASVLNQIMEGLVTLDLKDLKIKPQIASSWKISDDGLTYEFEIKKGILFHQHKLFTSESSRELKPRDVELSIELACTKNSKGESPHAYSFLYKDNLVGANDFNEGRSKSIKGVKISDSKITLKLSQKDDNFLNKLSNICAAITSEVIYKGDAEKDLIGTGPFLFSENKHGNPPSMVLLKNEDYYLSDDDGNSLPYLDSVIFIFQNRKLDQLEMFENHQTDIITGLPTSRIAKMLEGRINDFNSANSKPPLLVMYNNPLLLTNYYFFNMTDQRFSNIKVRQAFNYAIDKEKLGRDVLRNQYYELGYYGIVPPISKNFKGYNFKSIKDVSYYFNPEKARKLLAEAGYPNGKGFGSVNLRFNIDDIHSAVADEFAQQIFQVLNINVNIDGSTFELKDQDASKANGDIFRGAWAGDYANPETFLSNFYGKSVPVDKSQLSRINQSRYVNSIFDNLFEQAKNSVKKTDALVLYSKAEKVLMQNPPIIPLWYNGDIQIVYSNIRNLHFNALNMFMFKEVYKKEWTEEEYQKVNH